MNTPAIIEPKIRSIVELATSELIGHQFVSLSGSEVMASLGVSTEEFEQFASLWSNLKQDRYMADNGCYRFRRYGQFTLDAYTHKKTLLPHEPYVQSGYINALNGDVERFFEPLEEEFVNSRVLDQLLCFMAQSYADVLLEKVHWNVRLHPYRIIAQDGVVGLPTPEGLHRDGVTFIASILIKRHNIQGGVSTITDIAKNELTRMQLTDPLDLMLANDETTMHSVSPIHVDKKEAGQAYRDVLVVAYTKQQ